MLRLTAELPLLLPWLLLLLLNSSLLLLLSLCTPWCLNYSSSVLHLLQSPQLPARGMRSRIVFSQLSTHKELYLYIEDACEGLFMQCTNECCCCRFCCCFGCRFGMLLLTISMIPSRNALDTGSSSSCTPAPWILSPKVLEVLKP